jgi:hypothetical protein
VCGAIPPLPNTPSWRDAQLKNRDNLTFYLLLCYMFMNGLCVCLNLALYAYVSIRLISFLVWKGQCYDT